MAAAYAGVISFMHLMDQIKSYHSRQPVFLDEQLTQLKSIQQSVSFLQDFLEDIPTGGSKEATHLESQIVDVTNTIQDLIESYIVDGIHARYQEETDHVESKSFSELLQDFIQDIDMIKEKVMLLKQNSKINYPPRDLAEYDSIEFRHIVEVNAAYPVVHSFMDLMDKIQFYYVRQPIFQVEQLRQLESIQQIVSHLQDFLRGNSDGGIKDLEHVVSQILDAAYVIEDILKSHVGDDYEKKTGEKRDHVQSTSQGKKSPNNFSQGLQKAIEDMDFIKKEVVMFKEKSKLKDQQPRDLAPIASLGPHDLVEKDTVVGFDDNSVKIREMLTKVQSRLQIISITGMGGIGKTTVANNAYFHTLIMRHFDFRGWTTISQEYDMVDMLLNLLEVPVVERKEKYTDYHELGQKLHKKLSSRRYLIILDDMWSIEAWDKLSLFFPDNENGSRIMITTRLSNVANNFHNSNLYEMKLLDEIDSWNLLCKKVFAKENCLSELEEVGKKIAKSCNGLPLSISVIGGLLAKSNMTHEYWEYVANDISKTINSADNEHCYKILSLSYNHLPIHLKPCFLYMGLYPEDDNIRVSELIKLWVAEGILKPHREKSLEEVADDYLKDLIKRNLIFVSKFGSMGNMKYCKIHDLLRDLCLREAEKERFSFVIKEHNPDTSQDMNRHRRIAIHADMPNEKMSLRLLGALRTTSLTFTRSFTCNSECDWLKVLKFRLLRVLKVPNSDQLELIQMINTRYLRCGVIRNFTSSLYLIWNLQMFEISINFTDKPFDIWQLLQLRHVNINGVKFSDPSCCQKDKIDGYVLENLQSISNVISFICTEEVVKRIPNIKKLELYYPAMLNVFPHYQLHNLEGLYKLQSLHCSFDKSPEQTKGFLQHINLPDSLRKFTLACCGLVGEDITTKIGLLPHLEKLKLISCYTGKYWNTVEGQFLSLRYLYISNSGLIEWTTDCTHFPCLESLVLANLPRLKEIPYGIGEIETLRSIEVNCCSHSAVASAKEILKEQQSLGNADFRLVLKKGYYEEEDYGEEEEEEE